MKRFIFIGLSIFVFISSGCVVRTYTITKDRVDQDLTTGNRGYLQGQPTEEVKKTKNTRTLRTVEIELHPPVKFETVKKSETTEIKGDKEIWGNRGYITTSQTPQILTEPYYTPASTSKKVSTQLTRYEKYTVQSQDTLQKISLKFYGTTKKWNKIYEANKDILKSPDRIYPGQTLNIPLEDPSIQDNKK